MKVLFVINNLYTKGNGLSASVRRTIQALKERGVEVRVLSAVDMDPVRKSAEENSMDNKVEVPDYPLENGRIPIFQPLIDAQGYQFAKRDKKVIETAVEWADVIHLEEPFFLEIAVCKVAKRMNKPCVATYHLHPENLFASVGLEKSRWFNHMTMRVWRDTVFNRCVVVQCPTENVRERLERWHFKAELPVISNGITRESYEFLESDQWKKARLEAEEAKANQGNQENTPIQILSVGRLSKEKDQDTLLNAMKYSKYADRIQLNFAGRGPKEKHLKKKAKKLYEAGVLSHEATFGFYNREQLRELFSKTDLYVHNATIEVEGMSCMEAICTGIVPIIAEGKLTATAQFAKSKMSLYPERDAKVLAERIDYWIEHPVEREVEAKKYLGIEKSYLFEDTISKTIQMYRRCYD